MEKDEIIIRNSILHILDSTVGMPVLSHTLLDLGPDFNDFIRSHIFKIASGDDMKHCHFIKEESAVFPLIEHFDEENLITISQDIASKLYEIMNQNIDIPPADLLLSTYQVDSTLHLALLKMNYKDSYIHYTGNLEDKNSNTIMKQTATLPAESSKLTEAVLINLSDYSIQLVEKKYEINGVKENYLSSLFLGCQTTLSPKSKLAIVTKAVEQINKKYYEDDLDKRLETKSIIHNEYIEQGAIKVQDLGEKLFRNTPDIQEEFTEKLEKYHLEAEEVKPQNKSTTKKFEKQFLTTDSGIEINIPMEEYNNKERVEFITNPDGTISVLIKNINQIKSK